jgi:uncharacterized protein
VVEHNGDVYACDHFVYPEYRLGNIKEKPLIELASIKKQQQFGKDKFEQLPKECIECEFLRLCFGECPKNRLVITKDGKALNYLCPGLKSFFAHTAKAMQFMANEISQGKPAANVMWAFKG